MGGSRPVVLAGRSIFRPEASRCSSAGPWGGVSAELGAVPIDKTPSPASSPSADWILSPFFIGNCKLIRERQGPRRPSG